MTRLFKCSRKVDHVIQQQENQNPFKTNFIWQRVQRENRNESNYVNIAAETDESFASRNTTAATARRKNFFSEILAILKSMSMKCYPYKK